METSTKQRYFFIIPMLIRGKSHRRAEEPGTESQLSHFPSCVMSGELCVKGGAISLCHRAA